MTPVELKALEDRAAAIEKYRLDRTAEKARRAAESVKQDACVDPEDKRKPITI